MTDLSGEVLDRLRAWLPDDDEPERPQLQLATVDGDGRPDIRTLLLSAWDESGFVFHTDAASRKVTQLAAQPSVALAIVWPGFTRQLVVRGVAEQAAPAALERAYRSRSPYLKQLAWQNSLELAQQPRDERMRRWRAFGDEQDVTARPPSPTWTGYLVRPDRVTFWEPDTQGPSHRFEYEAMGADGWRLTHLAG
jgi:pyridoxamine 5'-phosphate oxidase